MLHLKWHLFWLFKSLELFNCRKSCFFKATINLKAYQCLNEICHNGILRKINFLRILLK